MYNIDFDHIDLNLTYTANCQYTRIYAYYLYVTYIIYYSYPFIQNA